MRYSPTTTLPAAMFTCLTIWCSLFIPMPSTAQDSLRVYQLDEVVVTGEAEPQSIQRSVYQIRTIPLERLVAQGATRLQDVLNTQLNIRFSQDLALGGSTMNMMGLPGQNVKILIDGVPMIGRQGTGNEINLNQINIRTIERIEIVEGPMSVVYGADALAGVINIITKKATDNRLEVSAAIHEESAGKEYGWSRGIHNQSISLGYKRNGWYVNGNLNRNDFRGWQGDSTEREREWHPKHQWLSGGLIGYQRNNVHVYYRADYVYETVYNPGQFVGNEAIDQRYITQRFMQQLQGSSQLSRALHFTGVLSHSAFERSTQSVAVNRITGRETLAAEALQNRDEFNGSTIRGIFRYTLTPRLSLNPGYDINFETGTGTRLQRGSNNIGDYAAFVSADYSITSRISIRPGLRFIHNTVYDAPPLIPSVNAKLTLSSKQDIRLSYGRGFRAPSIRELFFNFFDASHSIEGNPALKAELSHSIQASWNARLKDSERYNLSTSMAAFYNTIENLIDYGLRPGSNVTTYININQFKSTGVVLNGTITTHSTEFKIGFACTGRYNRPADDTNELPEFLWSPEINATLAHKLKKGWQFSYFHKYTGKATAYVFDSQAGLYTLSETKGFHWADVTLQKSFSRMISLVAGVRNVFDITRISNSGAVSGAAHSGTGASRPVGYGRSCFLSLNLISTNNK